MWCLITFYVSTKKTSHEHLKQGSQDFPSTVEVLILEKEQGEVCSNLLWIFCRIWMWYNSLGSQNRIPSLLVPQIVLFYMNKWGKLAELMWTAVHLCSPLWKPLLPDSKEAHPSTKTSYWFYTVGSTSQWHSLNWLHCWFFIFCLLTAGNSESDGQEAVRKIKEETLTGKGTILCTFL